MRFPIPPRARRFVWLPILLLLILGGTVYRIFATGGTPTVATGNLRQPFANSNGLLEWYPLDGDTKDYSGNHYDGTATNFTYDGTTNGWTNGKFGNSLMFNGSNDRLTTANTTLMDNLSSFTISAWVNIKTFSTQRSAVGNYSSGAGILMETGNANSNSVLLAAGGGGNPYPVCHNRVRQNAVHEIV